MFTGIGPFKGYPIEYGTAQGQMAFWDATRNTWTHTETSEMYWDDGDKSLGLGTSNTTFSAGGGLHIAHSVQATLRLERTGSGGNSWDIGSGGVGALAFYNADSATLAIQLLPNGDILAPNGNVGIGVSEFGTNAAKVYGQGNGTDPASQPADMFQMWSKDQTAGNACPHFMTENGATIKIYQQAHITDAPGDSTANNATTINAILVALETNGLLAAA